jgi:pimeloyl-ACP methyl ester carboxylesterase
MGYVDVGPSSGPPVILLHGWPYDIHTFVDVAPLLTSRGYRAIVPYLRGYGTTHFLSSETPRNGQPSVAVPELWPERCKAMVSVSGHLIGSRDTNKMPLPPKSELEWWYQFYFATERGRAGYATYRREFAKLIWRLASPRWNFDDATFDRTAASFENPDHVDIVIHNYRWRLGLAEGERKYDALEERLAKSPVITVPAITLEGDANGAPPPPPISYVKKFGGKYTHRDITGGIGQLASRSPARLCSSGRRRRQVLSAIALRTFSRHADRLT